MPADDDGHVFRIGFRFERLGVFVVGKRGRKWLRRACLATLQPRARWRNCDRVHDRYLLSGLVPTQGLSVHRRFRLPLHLEVRGVRGSNHREQQPRSSRRWRNARAAPKHHVDYDLDSNLGEHLPISRIVPSAHGWSHREWDGNLADHRHRSFDRRCRSHDQGLGDTAYRRTT